MDMAKVHRWYVNDSSLGNTGKLDSFYKVWLPELQFFEMGTTSLLQDRKSQRQLDLGVELEEVQGQQRAIGCVT